MPLLQAVRAARQVRTKQVLEQPCAFLVHSDRTAPRRGYLWLRDFVPRALTRQRLHQVAQTALWECIRSSHHRAVRTAPQGCFKSQQGQVNALLVPRGVTAPPLVSLLSQAYVQRVCSPFLCPQVVQAAELELTLPRHLRHVQAVMQANSRLPRNPQPALHALLAAIVVTLVSLLCLVHASLGITQWHLPQFARLVVQELIRIQAFRLHVFRAQQESRNVIMEALAAIIVIKVNIPRLRERPRV